MVLSFSLFFSELWAAEIPLGSRLASPATAATRSGESLLQIGNPIENLGTLELDAQAREPPPPQAPPPLSSSLLPSLRSPARRACEPVTKSRQAMAHAQLEGLGVSAGGFRVSRF